MYQSTGSITLSPSTVSRKVPAPLRHVARHMQVHLQLRSELWPRQLPEPPEAGPQVSLGEGARLTHSPG